MATNTPCTRCGHVGLCRVEHIIKGTETVQAWYCGACEHEWQEPQQAPPTTPLQPYIRKPATRTLKGK